MSNRGGKRENAGRPRGQGRFGEPTIAIRIPQSQGASIKMFLDAYQSKRTGLNEEATNVDEFFTPAISDQSTRLPLFSTKVAAGFPSPADDYVEKRLDISEFLIDHAASTFFVTIKGESMIDVGLLPGDKVVVDRSKTPGIGNIVLAVVDREFTIKIFDRTKNGRPRLLPANSSGAYLPIEIIEGMQFEIFGVVTGSFRRFE
ncbi:MAG: translesion error-prone DNA polymerase V autoproteolytic subunit [Nitrosomonas sp.]|uniref:LexA family protein n=1 Tax=Nitrosomonas sp. TaxID=42353 RepID=UPI0025D4B08B|nr:translesion error-prone DNA polymerase V autoproteolytic subunit [Nitrosomonas sp.]MBY0475830.1 translesion error-prone DNA polymerase V autoproteolytic subunit [Nitrosomonas sp.]